MMTKAKGTPIPTAPLIIIAIAKSKPTPACHDIGAVELTPLDRTLG